MGKLNNLKINALTPKDTIQKITDGGGLYLEVRPSGSKIFRLAFRLKENGKLKQKIYTIGKYPSVTLAYARKKALDAKELIAQGIDPVHHEVRKEGVVLFQTVAMEYLQILAPRVQVKRLKKQSNLLKNYIYPTFEKREIKSISRQDVLKLVLSLDTLNKKTVPSDVLGLLKNIFEYALEQGLIEYSPHSPSMNKRLKPYLAKHHPHLNFEELPQFFQTIEKTTSAPHILIGLKLTMLLFPRASEIRHARWEHVDWENRRLFIPSIRMKGAKYLKESGVLARYIMLSTQAFRLLKALHQLTGTSEFLLHGQRKTQVISDATMNKILNNLGYKGRQDIHGFRGLASTYLNEHYPEKESLIELCLAHKQKNDVQLAYDHSKKLPLLREVWQLWGDYLENQGMVIPTF